MLSDSKCIIHLVLFYILTKQNMVLRNIRNMVLSLNHSLPLVYKSKFKPNLSSKTEIQIIIIIFIINNIIIIYYYYY